MILDVYFAGIRINKYCIIKNVYPTVPAHGETQRVDVEIEIQDNERYNMDQLNRLLFTDGYYPLVIGDTRDRRLMAKLDGPISWSSRFRYPTAVLSFESKEKYWKSTTHDPKPVEADGLGFIQVDNKGTAPTKPITSFVFPDECGYVSLTSPNGMITVGNIDELDKEPLPESESLMKEEMHQVDKWTRSYHRAWWKEFKAKFDLGEGVPKFDKYGLRIGRAPNGINDGWNAFSYMYNFPGPKGNEFSTRLVSRISLYDASGNTKGTGQYMIQLADWEGKPIMSAALFNVGEDNNEVIAVAKYFDHDNKDEHIEKVYRQFRFPNGFKGTIEMEHSGNRMYWKFNSHQREQPGGSEIVADEGKAVGTVCYIKKTATHYMHGNGVKVPIAGWIAGQAFWIKQERWRNGQREVLLAQTSQWGRETIIAWIESKYVTRDRNRVGVVRQTSSGGKKLHEVTYNHPMGRQLRPSRVMVWGGAWARREPFSHTNLSSVYVDRIYGKNKFYDIRNLFQPRDVLKIDNRTQEVTLNNRPFVGKVDVDRHFFSLDPGRTELSTQWSDWARKPRVLMNWGEYYR